MPQTFSHKMLAQEPIRTKGGTVRITDSKNFPASKTIAAALVELEPGAMRELHWHPNADEWQYYIEGEGRMTVFASSGQARTFDYRAGDVGYVPFAMGHYVENTGSKPLRFLELFQQQPLRRPVAQPMAGADAAGAGAGAHAFRSARDGGASQDQVADRPGMRAPPHSGKSKCSTCLRGAELLIERNRRRVRRIGLNEDDRAAALARDGSQPLDAGARDAAPPMRRLDGEIVDVELAAAALEFFELIGDEAA